MKNKTPKTSSQKSKGDTKEAKAVKWDSETPTTLLWGPVGQEKDDSSEKEILTTQTTDFHLPPLEINLSLRYDQQVSSAVSKLDRLIQTDELPLTLAVKLTNDVIKLEREFREERLLNEIRIRRKEYELHKRASLNHRMKCQGEVYFGQETSRIGFSYFKQLSRNDETRLNSQESRKIPYGASVNEKRFDERQENAIRRMQAFGRRYPSKKQVSAKFESKATFRH
ncbi:uncharacterized protein LOC125573264 [Nematostella vectensis]|uniref:uncharacterized protein LOC125573264 n=1 Tax=Nematostella vectensis TaxID=45351 RepID=UPI00207701CC|nr:uncharacterized protein LOC125573264 [Nematostella vectensis]XP_048589678.1 uncharacterized protein LOC125573264 [Nematostella vectensis]XP_048589679.1 uncharacterized protein LOC125573264 [Nematostella vectensis]